MVSGTDVLNCRRAGGRRGQVLLLYTLSLLTMIGMFALAVDLGLAYHARRAEQSAADSAAKAAVIQAFSIVGQKEIVASSCPAGMTCSAQNFACTSAQTKAQIAANSLAAGCVYAAEQGFVDNGDVSVKLDAGLGNPPGLNVAAEYWVTARVAQRRPSLFAGIFGAFRTSTAARATAALVNRAVDASLILLNRDLDPALGGDIPAGVNLEMGGTGSIVVPGGVLMASKSGSSPWAAEGGPNPEVWASYTWVNDPGWVEHPENFFNTDGTRANPPQQKHDGNDFFDPERDKGQPTATMGGLPVCPVIGGTITGPITLAPAVYYAATKDSKTGAIVPTYEPLVVKNSGVQFASKAAAGLQDTNVFGAHCPQGDWSGGQSPSSFGNYVFYGGLNNRGSGGNSGDPGFTGDITVQNGMYFVAGVCWGNNCNGNSPGNNDVLLDLGSNMTVSDGQPTGKVDQPGEVFVLTDAKYAGLPKATTDGNLLPANWDATLTGFQEKLKQGPSNIQAGSGSTSLNLHGLNKENSTIAGSALEQFDRIVVWQDRRNSAIRYDATGHPACGDDQTGPSCEKSQSELQADNVDPNKKSTRLKYQGSSSSQVWGVFYQPRGAYVYLHGGGVTGADAFLQIITGAAYFWGSANMHVKGLAPISRRTVALVQ